MTNLVLVEHDNAALKSATLHVIPAAQKIVTSDGKIRHEYLVVWAGDFNAADNHSASLAKTSTGSAGSLPPQPTTSSARVSASNSFRSDSRVNMTRGPGFAGTARH